MKKIQGFPWRSSHCAKSDERMRKRVPSRENLRGGGRDEQCLLRRLSKPSRHGKQSPLRTEDGESKDLSWNRCCRTRDCALHPHITRKHIIKSHTELQDDFYAAVWTEGVAAWWDRTFGRGEISEEMPAVANRRWPGLKWWPWDGD